VLRTEDPELLTGAARYVADLENPHALQAVFVRSEYAHARVVSVDSSAALSLPGVVAVLTATDLDLRSFHGMAKVHADFAMPALVTDTVRYVGDRVAVVLADSAVVARDAAALVEVEYEPLPVVVDPEAALAAGAPVLFPAHGDNVALTVAEPANGDPLAGATRVVRGRYENQRMAVVPMEPHGVAAVPNPDGRLTVFGSTQMPHLLQQLLARALGVDSALVRVVTPHVGGGFGGKAGLYPEQLVVAAAALRLGRPVVWIGTRSDDMVALAHSRAQVQYVELGCRDDGTFTGLRVRLVGDAGAYPGMGAYLPTGTRRMSNGVYRFGAIQFDVAVACTNTTPTGAYRGAGRPEATALLERAVDQAALELGIDPIDLRMRNLLGADIFPHTTLTGVTYDSGDYALPLREAARLAGYDELRAEQRARRERGDRCLLGIGVSAYVEITAGGTQAEHASVTVLPDGTATVQAGTSAHGQGHQTSFAMIVSHHTGIPVGRIRLAAVDTDVVPTGGGTGGSRSLQLGGSAVQRATEALIDRAVALAASLLEADPADIVVDASRGTLGVVGVPARSLTWAEVATASGDEPLGAAFDFAQQGATFPFGAHIAVVEVDRDTGATTLLRVVAVDDCGTVLNPLLVEGQQHGGIAAGVGQALFEHVRFDSSGNPLTATLVDYAIPSAAELPMFEVHSTQTPTPLNPLGAKGIGEASTIGSTPAVQNAVIDAVAHLGVRHIDMPCTSERVWRAIDAAARGTLPEPWSQPPDVFMRLRADLPVDPAAVAAAEGI
jgi:carbon-monoxide dehydrogenase large subunit